MAFIDSNRDYPNIQLWHQQQLQLQVDGPRSGEYTAGYVVGIMTLLWDQAGANPTYTLKVGSFKFDPTYASGVGPLHFDLMHPDQFVRQLGHFIVAEDVSAADVPLQSSLAGPRSYGWWIRATYTAEPEYNLYQFQTKEFIHGFLEAFTPFQADFRTYIAGTPFRYDMYTRAASPIPIEGYDIKPFDPEPRIPDLLVPYETMSYEIGVPHGIDFD